MERLFDRLVLKDGTQLHGIIDYITVKHIYFFDFTKEKPEELVFQAILWKGNNTGVRFSVYMAIENPTTYLPRAILIPIRSVQFTESLLETTKKAKQKRTIKSLVEH